MAKNVSRNRGEGVGRSRGTPDNQGYAPRNEGAAPHNRSCEPDWNSFDKQPLPLAVELRPTPDPVAVFRKLSRLRHCLFLDSAMRHATLGRYSFVTADPFKFYAFAAGDQDLMSAVQAPLRTMAGDHHPNLPPFQGGMAGLFGYDLGRGFERLPKPGFDEFQVPALAVGFYDVVVAFDHVEDRAWVVSQGLPEQQPAARRRRARARLEQFCQFIDCARGPDVTRDQGELSPVSIAELAPEFPASDELSLTSNFDRQAYCRTIECAIDYIHAGDIFQVNLAQRLLHPAMSDPVSLYFRLRQCNPAPFAGFFDLGSFQIASASPERFLAVRDRCVETRPIKGTRPRCRLPEADLFAGDELQASEKDRAENVMIVDLLRNDLARVCLPDSVQVTQLCGLEMYQYVQHLVSVVRARLAPGRDALDLIRATFPGGSITGAPKVRAMEIIAELEPTARGPYCGALGYLGFNGWMDLSILIRTITVGRGWWQLPVGGGIVAQSVPEQEYEETWHKAHGLIRALVGRDISIGR